jgi:hypothetical protein
MQMPQGVSGLNARLQLKAEPYFQVVAKFGQLRD